SRLALVPPSAGAGAAGDRPGTAGGTDQSAELRSDLARTKELLASSNQESAELRERVAELEKIQGDTSRLLELRSTEMAELQRRLAAAEEESARLRVEQAAAERTAAAAAAAVTSNAAPDAVSAPDTASATPTEPAVPPADAAIATEAEAEAAPVEEPVAETAPTDTTTTDTTAADTTDSLAPVETEPETGGEPLPETTADAAGTAEVTPLPEPEPVDTSAPIEPDAPSWMAYLRNPWVLGGAGAIAILALLALFARARRREVEAAASDRPSVADSFNGGVFGGGAAAAATAAADEERDLLEQLASDPTSVDSHLDLLRLYYARGDADKFEAAAGALYAQVPGPDSPAWLEAAEMGRALCPGNALFESAAVAEREEFDFDRVETPTTPPPAHYAPDEPIATRYTPPAATSATTPAPATTPTPAESFDFNLLEDTPRAAPPVDADQSTQQMPALDFTAETPAAPEGTAGDFLSADDAVGTKLDLARAYLDMGDPEGARSMLQEVLAEGSASQKSEAQRLLADIG
ncbi:MAG TPA: FimV/HubP family polar landmark protein, partial [Xanthomonadales bacterium]|nr:FimV/HubP family polar landmark protein [Xanthomonadales bacterium]